MIIDADSLDPTAAYQLLIRSIVPRAISLLATSETVIRSCHVRHDGSFDHRCDGHQAR